MSDASVQSAHEPEQSIAAAGIDRNFTESPPATARPKMAANGQNSAGARQGEAGTEAKRVDADQDKDADAKQVIGNESKQPGAAEGGASEGGADGHTKKELVNTATASKGKASKGASEDCGENVGEDNKQ